MSYVYIIQCAVGPHSPSFQRPRTVAQDVYEYLRTELLAGRLAAGTWMREQEVARTLDVSRTPVREALSRLAEYAQMRASLE